MPELQHWKPDNAAHSVQQVVGRLIFNQELTDVPWKRISPEARTTAQKMQLDVESPVQEVSFQILPGGPRPNQPVNTGYDFLRMERPDFYSDKFSVTRRELVFEEWRYTRWAALADKIRKTVISIGEKYLESVTLSAIQLQYVDRFEAIDSQRPKNCSEVLRQPSRFIAAAAFSEDQPWHSHCGFFEQVDNKIRRLANINVDVADLQPQITALPVRMVRIRSTLTDLLSQPGFQPIEADEVTAALLEERFHDLHLRSKTIFAEIVSEAAAADVSLKG